MVVFWQNDCIREKVVVFGQSLFIRAKVVVFGQSDCIRAKEVAMVQKCIRATTYITTIFVPIQPLSPEYNHFARIIPLLP